MQIVIQNITKSFGRNEAVRDVSFSIEGKKIIGLLGRNGAGKTSFMKMLAGHFLPTKGEIFINGEIPFENRSITENICFVMESGNFYKDMRVKDVLKSYANFYPSWDDELAIKLLKDYKLNEKARIKTLSKGMVSAVGVIVGLASKAPITMFDEPYIGLDAAARNKFYETLLSEFEKDERLIILSTHLIDEVNQLFEEIVILKDGQLLMQAHTDELREKAFIISGKKSDVKVFIKDKKVIQTKQFANMMTAHLLIDRKEAEASNLHVEQMPIQDLMIYLTESEKEVH